jgi:putative endonuclease
MTYFVYILYSEKDKELYTGCTSNLVARFKKHQSGEVPATKFRRPLVLIYNESFTTKNKAFVRERFLKTKWGNTFKQRVKHHYINKISHTNKKKV